MSERRFDPQAHAQVVSAIERNAALHYPDHQPHWGRCVAAVGLAVFAVQALAEERSCSIEAVLDELIEFGPVNEKDDE